MSLPSGYLSREGRQWRQVKLLDLAVLLYHVHRGAQKSTVGFEDAARTLADITKELERTVPMNPSVLESALWSCNLMDEQGKFWHPYGATFQEFVKGFLLPGETFKSYYNLIERKDSK